ncbi:FRG domain-containing protein [Tessaracoccus sp. MC1865]|uniref:FRG domain-containing protein n=1 Tax=Tessaracoccus sp. MC1865 TaxID=2760310 RepID=UPI00353038A3
MTWRTPTRRNAWRPKSGPRGEAGSWRLSPDRHDSIRITGQLPVADAALLAAQLEALLPSASSYANAGETPGPDVRRADALVLLVQAAAASGELPAHGGDRPRVHITMHLDTLTTGLGAVGLPGLDVDGLTPGAARRMACDAGVIPMVLGSDSQPLNVGREHRLFTPAIRAALIFRDAGCAFPHCAATPASCEAHHIIPWWAGGESSINNLASYQSGPTCHRFAPAHGFHESGIEDGGPLRHQPFTTVPVGSRVWRGRDLSNGFMWKMTGWYVEPKSARDVMQVLGSIGVYSRGQKFAWRGMSSIDFDLRSSLHRRLGHKVTEDQMRRAELASLAEARNWGFGITENGHVDDLQLLADLQHFGAPTRLLDFTSNPMTALWFACQPAT